MLQHPQIDPVAFSLGPLSVHWYGLMYLIGFGAAYALGSWRAKQPNSGWNSQMVSDLVFFAALGVILGGRMGYVFFYNFDKFLQEPLWLFQVWTGGMSFHGGFLGVLLAALFFCRKYQRHFLDITDFTAVLVPIGLGAGRLGNFIGGELYGRTTELPWGMLFSGAGDLPRHPSQLYQAALEGALLFIILWWLSARARPRGFVSALFLIFYGLFRFAVEFVREPDSHIGFDLFGWMTRGQLLCVPMVLLGGLVLAWSLKRSRYAPSELPAALASLKGGDTLEKAGTVEKSQRYGDPKNPGKQRKSAKSSKKKSKAKH